MQTLCLTLLEMCGRHCLPLLDCSEGGNEYIINSSTGRHFSPLELFLSDSGLN